MASIFKNGFKQAYMFVVLEEINVTVPVRSILAELRLDIDQWGIKKGNIQAQGREVKTQNVANWSFTNAEAVNSRRKLTLPN